MHRLVICKLQYRNLQSISTHILYTDLHKHTHTHTKKVQVKLSLYLIKYYAMKAYGGVDVFFFFPLVPLLGSSLTYWSTGLITQFLDLSHAVGLLGRVISSSQGLCRNTGQHKHRKTPTHIKHPYPGRDSKPQSWPPSDRRLFMPETARLPRPAADVYTQVCLTSALVGGKWSASCPGRFTPEERAPGTHWIGGWVHPRAGLDTEK
jgi:hypothetical protein